MKRQPAIFAVCCMLVLAGCSSIPLSTLWKMRSFGPDVFARIKPEELRVKVLLPKGYILDTDKYPPSLNFTIHSAGKTTENKIKLEKISEADIAEKSGPFSSTTVTKHQYEMKFAQDSLDKFAQLQQLVKSSEKNSTQIELNISINLAEMPDKATGVNFTVSLLFFPKDGYFVLLDNARLDFKDLQQK